VINKVVIETGWYVSAAVTLQDVYNIINLNSHNKCTVDDRLEKM